MNRVIVRAYVETGALEHPCPTCGVAADDWCTHAGDYRRTPCVARCRVSSPEVGAADPEPCREAAAERSALYSAVMPDQPTLDYADPSEPRHPRGDG